MEPSHLIINSQEASILSGKGPGTRSAGAICGNGAPPQHLRHTTNDNPVPTCRKCRAAILKDFSFTTGLNLAICIVLGTDHYKDWTKHYHLMGSFYRCEGRMTLLEVKNIPLAKDILEETELGNLAKYVPDDDNKIIAKLLQYKYKELTHGL